MIDFAESKADGVLILEPQVQTIDGFNSSAFRERLLGYIRGGASQIVLDLSSVDYIDSTGLAAVVFAAKEIRPGELMLTGLNDFTRRVFKLTRLDKAIRILPQRLDRPDADESAASGTVMAA